MVRRLGQPAVEGLLLIRRERPVDPGREQVKSFVVCHIATPIPGQEARSVTEGQAPKGRQPIARGASPWTFDDAILQAPKGRQQQRSQVLSVAPSGLSRHAPSFCRNIDRAFVSRALIVAADTPSSSPNSR